jgi:hypothetical protein
VVEYEVWEVRRKEVVLCCSPLEFVCEFFGTRAVTEASDVESGTTTRHVERYVFLSFIVVPWDEQASRCQYLDERTRCGCLMLEDLGMRSKRSSG